MTAYLQHQLKSRLKATNLSIYALEKKSGLNRGTASNILRGLSKHPSAENLSAIAKALNCSIEDLIGSDYLPKRPAKSKSIPDETLEWKEGLFASCMNEVTKILEKRKIKLKYSEVLILIKEVYKFSIAKNANTADSEFANYLAERIG